MTANLALPTSYLVAMEEWEEEASESSKELEGQADYAYGDGDDDPTTTKVITTAYLETSRLFSFLGKNDSKTIGVGVPTIAYPLPCPRYLLFLQLKLDC